MRDDETIFRNLDWNLLKVFDEIVRSRGVSAAARQLERNQPAVSLALKRFEDRLGTTLCRRGPGGFELLVEGEPVAETCRDIARRRAQARHDRRRAGDRQRGVRRHRRADLRTAHHTRKGCPGIATGRSGGIGTAA